MSESEVYSMKKNEWINPLSKTEQILWLIPQSILLALAIGLGFYLGLSGKLPW